jgi:hypothetical protein
MGQASSTIDFASALRDPTAIFSEPNDIVAHPQLSREMKLSLLRQWEQTARSLSVAESEGMGGGEESRNAARVDFVLSATTDRLAAHLSESGIAADKAKSISH